MAFTLHFHPPHVRALQRTLMDSITNINARDIELKLTKLITFEACSS